MIDTRCPKCKGFDYIDLPDLYTVALTRLEDHPDQASAVAEGGLTNMQIVEKFAPPQRRSPVPRVLLFAVPLAAGAGYVYQRFGATPGQFAGIGAGVVTIAVLLTTLRRVSDDFYARRRVWRHRYLCRQCGTLVDEE